MFAPGASVWSRTSPSPRAATRCRLLAVGASVAYPILRLVRAIPMPVLLVGAELFFAGSKTCQSAVQKPSDVASNLSDEARRRGHDLSDQIGASVATARDAATDAVDRAGETVSTGADRLRASAGSAGAALNAQTDTVRDSTASLTDTVSAKGRDLKGSVVNLADAASERIKGIASDSSSTAQSALASTLETFATASAASDRAGKSALKGGRSSGWGAALLSHVRVNAPTVVLKRNCQPRSGRLPS